ncbi:MAG TPA: FHA domain-containing protein [Thermoanaerobaculia bacterium]|nr:FHA domain-containing protein [Thermoanaerobaculia bacterium]
MADKRCDNGHFIDETWDICPYCPQDASEPEIPVIRPRAVEPSPARLVTSGAAGFSPPDRDGSLKAAAPQARSATSPGLAAPQPMERTVAAAQLNASKRYVVGWLVSLNGASRGESYPVRMGRNVIGRDRRSDVVVNDEQASSHHADLVFRPEEKRFILMDHNSTNGTYVNETEIEPRRDLAAKDIIRIGAHRFLFTPLCHDGFHWDDEGLLK